MKRYNVRLSGLLTTQSPVTIVPPNSEEIVRADRSKYRRVATLVTYADGLRETRPIVPGSTLRGRLRRSAVEVYLGLTGNKIPLAEWHQNAVGGIKGSEAESGFDVAMRGEIRDRNPVLSLFGAGSPWIASRVKIDHAVPTHPVDTTIVGGVRADDGRRDDDFFKKLDGEAVDEWIALVDANAARTKHKAEVKQMTADLRKARKDKNEAETVRLEAALKASSSDDDAAATLASNPVSMPLQHETMPAGVTLAHGITLTAVTEEEIGLFFAAVNRFMKLNPAVGQHENMGYGLFKASYNISMDEVGQFDPFVVGNSSPTDAGTITAEPFAGLVDVPQRIVDCMGAFKAAFQSGRYDFSLVKSKQDAVAE